MNKALSPSAQKVQDKLDELGFELQVIEHNEPTRSAQEAAKAIGTSVAQIAKSLIFRAKESERAVLVIASGVNRVKEKAIQAELGEKIGRAEADFVREQSGYAIGGVPPLGHRNKLVTYIDEDLMQFDEIWAAGGTPNAVFKLRPEQLVTMTNGKVLRIK